jgi:hypothetical protein
VSYTQGPPKITSVAPAPGSSTPAPSSPSDVRIGFSDNVNASGAAFSVSKVGGANVPFTYSYNSSTYVATLTFTTRLGEGTYTVTAADSIVSSVGSIALDGEMASNTAAALPSGNGGSGGAAVFSFTITAPPCPADFDHSGQVTIDDIFIFLNAWFAGSTIADFDGVNGVTIDDIFVFLNAWFVGC